MTGRKHETAGVPAERRHPMNIRNMHPIWHVTLYALAAYILATGPGLPGIALSAALIAAGAAYQMRRRRHDGEGRKP